VGFTSSPRFLEGQGKTYSKGSIANTPATKTMILIASLSCIQRIKKIWAGRHSTDTTSMNNPGNELVSGTEGWAHGALWYAQWNSIHVHRRKEISPFNFDWKGSISNSRVTLSLASFRKPSMGLGTAPEFLVRTRELMVALTLKIRAT
jgi:hypothetical protein